jgi:hypothetical protein
MADRHSVRGERLLIALDSKNLMDNTRYGYGDRFHKKPEISR